MSFSSDYCNEIFHDYAPIKQYTNLCINVNRYYGAVTVNDTPSKNVNFINFQNIILIIMPNYGNMQMSNFAQISNGNMEPSYLVINIFISWL